MADKKARIDICFDTYVCMRGPAKILASGRNNLKKKILSKEQIEYYAEEGDNDYVCDIYLTNDRDTLLEVLYSIRTFVDDLTPLQQRQVAFALDSVDKRYAIPWYFGDELDTVVLFSGE